MRLRQIFLTAFILFHLLSIFVLPNPDSILYRKLASPVVTYGNFFGFNTTWRFFSPNPLIRIMEYKVFTPGSDGQLAETVFRYPRDLKDEGSRETYNRKLANSMVMLMREDFLKEIIGPKICGWHPGAETVSISMKGRVWPTIEKSALMGEEKRHELGQIQTQHVMDINCDLKEKVDGAEVTE